MKALLDTHTFLWWITNDSRISNTVRGIIENSQNDLYFSAASGWEIAIKLQTGKLSLKQDPLKFLINQLTLNAINHLDIRLEHALHTYSLPVHHKDPFDRILIAQSQLEEMPLLSTDSLFDAYNVQIIW